MAATLSGSYSSAPDTPSPVYPDRLIRPLPKRPLRSRLSPEVAGSIRLPPSPPVSQIFNSSGSENGEPDGKRSMQQQFSDSYDRERSPERDHRHPYENGVDVESGDEDSPVVIRRSAAFRASSLPPSTPTSNGHYDDMPTKSSPVGLDGYDAFENTNNKKKRKIPTSGSLSSHHSSLASDLANMGISSSGSSSPGLETSRGGTYGSSGSMSGGGGISGPGRGRFGRQRDGRAGARNLPLSYAKNSWLRRESTPPSQPKNGDGSGKYDQGIISTAIANAAALSPASSGQENGSLLDQQSNHSPPSKTQFTFTCESDSSKTIAMQSSTPYPLTQQSRHLTSSLSHGGQSQRDFSTQGTQTSPSMGAVSSSQQAPQQPGSSTSGQGQGTASSTGKKTRRSAASIYALAARQRRIQQQYANLHHPPDPEDIWICEFCEYEAIFGHPPEALIRQYEIKDRKERRRLAEKRRLLEKAKMKGRKGRKATKSSTKHANATQTGSHRHSDHGSIDPAGPHPDDYLGPEYDDDLIPPPAPGPLHHPAKTSGPSAPGTRRSSDGESPPPKGVSGGGGTNRNT